MHFNYQAQNAQNGGAIGVIISNYVDEYPFNMDVDEQNPDITIPSVMVGFAAGQRIKRSIYNYKDSVSLSYDAERKEILSSHISLPGQCNRVRSPPFVLGDKSAISVWVNFGIDGMVDDSIYDRANVGLLSKGKRVTIAPDDGHLYNSFGMVNTKNIEACPVPGTIGWRKGTGPAVKKVTFSPNALQDTNLSNEIVELEFALASGTETHGSYFAIQKVELTNVGLLKPGTGGGICETPTAAPLTLSSPSTSENLDLDLNSTVTTPSLADGSVAKESGQEQGSFYTGKDDLVDDNTIRDGRDRGVGGGLISAIIFLLVLAIIVVAAAYVSRWRRKFPDHNLCSLTNGSDLENPVYAPDTADISLAVAIPVSVQKKEQNESKIDKSQSDPTVKRTLSARTESLSSSFASSSEEGKDNDDEAQSLQSDEDINDDDAASKMMSFINIFL